MSRQQPKWVVWTWCIMWFAMFVMWLISLTPIVQGQEPARAFASPQHPFLNRLAVQHASYMAAVQIQGHQGFEHRFAVIQASSGGCSVEEICAETWPWQRNATWPEQWAEYERCWRQSPGHWRTARSWHRWIGVGSARGRNGIWYGCLIAVD